MSLVAQWLEVKLTEPTEVKGEIQIFPREGSIFCREHSEEVMQVNVLAADWEDLGLQDVSYQSRSIYETIKDGINCKELIFVGVGKDARILGVL